MSDNLYATSSTAYCSCISLAYDIASDETPRPDNSFIAEKKPQITERKIWKMLNRRKK